MPWTFGFDVVKMSVGTRSRPLIWKLHSIKQRHYLFWFLSIVWINTSAKTQMWTVLCQAVMCDSFSESKTFQAWQSISSHTQFKALASWISFSLHMFSVFRPLANCLETMKVILNTAQCCVDQVKLTFSYWHWCCGSVCACSLLFGVIEHVLMEGT